MLDLPDENSVWGLHTEAWSCRRAPPSKTSGWMLQRLVAELLGNPLLRRIQDVWYGEALRKVELTHSTDITCSDFTHWRLTSCRPTMYIHTCMYMIKEGYIMFKAWGLWYTAHPVRAGMTLLIWRDEYSDSVEGNTGEVMCVCGGGECVSQGQIAELTRFADLLKNIRDKQSYTWKKRASMYTFLVLTPNGLL